MKNTIFFTYKKYIRTGCVVFVSEGSRVRVFGAGMLTYGTGSLSQKWELDKTSWLGLCVTLCAYNNSMLCILPCELKCVLV